MKTMIKRIFITLLTFSMLTGSAPAYVFAAEELLEINPQNEQLLEIGDLDESENLDSESSELSGDETHDLDDIGLESFESRDEIQELSTDGLVFDGMESNNDELALENNEAGAPVLLGASGSDLDYALKFTASDAFTFIFRGGKCDGTMSYCLASRISDGWNDVGNDDISVSVPKGDVLYVRGTDNTKTYTSRGGIFGIPLFEYSTYFREIYCDGNVETLLDWQKVKNGEHPSMSKDCFRNLFQNWSYLVKAPSLPATTLSDGCYSRMFYACDKLTQAPALPATELKDSCYAEMFRGCKKLESAPQLSSVKLANKCYACMFAGCCFQEAPNLPATTLAPECYAEMFLSCSNLVKPPLLPATTLADGCYKGMFNKCNGLRISVSKTDTYKYPYCIPRGSNGVVGSDSLTNMFYAIDGASSGTPEINKMYYTDRPWYTIDSASIRLKVNGNVISDSTMIYEVQVGDVIKCDVDILPEDATNAIDHDVVWSLSDTSVVTVDAKDEITAKSSGVTTVTAKTADNCCCSATFTVIVTQPVTGIVLNKTETIIKNGQTETLIATVSPDDANDKSVTWSSDRPAIAEVDSNGKVIAKAKGIAIITATANDGSNVSASCEVTVIQPVTDIVLNKTETTIKNGQTETLTVTVSPDGASDKSVIWSSDRPTVAEVDSNGKITAKSKGTANITATANDGSGKSATCAVTVWQPVVSVSFERNKENIVRGQTLQLTPTIAPDNANTKTVTWSSDDDSVATVSNNGLVTAHAVGVVSITATANDGSDKSATCLVTVLPVSVTGISLNKERTALTIGNTEDLLATVEPSTADDKRIVWSSGDNSIVTVTQGGVIKGVSVGETTVTATTVDGNFSASCTVTVNPIHVSSVFIDSKLTVNIGKTAKLTAFVSPDNATDKSIVWKSDNTSIATVDQTGLVQGVSVGKTNVTVTSVDGNKTCTCEVNVTPITAGEVLLSDHQIYLTVGGEDKKLTARILPDDTTDKSVVWTTNNSKVATIDANGNVHPVGVGLAIITVTTNSENRKDMCEVIVTSVEVTYEIKVEKKSDGTAVVKGTDDNTAPENKRGDLVIPDSINGDTVSEIGAGAFAGETGFDGSLVIPESVTAIGDGAFDGMTNVGEVTNNSDVDVPTSSFVDEKEKEDVCFTDENGNKIYYDENLGKGTYTRHFLAKNVVAGRKDVELEPGASFELGATVLPEKATDPSVTYFSGNDDIVKVDESGKMTGMKVGETTVTVASNDTGVTDTCNVKVVSKKATGITLNKSSVTLKKGGTFQLVATVTPADAKDKTVIYASADNKVVTVDKNGNVKAVGKGKAIVTATTNDGGLKATCEFTVEEEAGKTDDPVKTDVEVTGILLDKGTLSLNVGDTAKITAKVMPDNATDKTVTWSSDNAKVASVDKNGNVKAVSAGVVNISARTGKYSATCKVTVIEQGKKVEVESIKLNKSKATVVKGKNITLKATISPLNATDQTLTWKTSNKKVATVSKNGKVKGIKKGTAIITVSTSNGKTATCKISVKNPVKVKSVKLNKTKATIKKGKTLQLKATVKPKNATNKAVTWSSSNKKIATVSKNGKVKGIKKGTVTITVKTKDGKKKAKCKVTVK